MKLKSRSLISGFTARRFVNDPRCVLACLTAGQSGDRPAENQQHRRPSKSQRYRTCEQVFPMENFKLVLPEHLNQYQFLFGGNLLKFVDEIAWIAASLEYPGFNFVTIAMDRVEFRRSVREGSILRFQCDKTKTGTTSVSYHVDVFIANATPANSDSVFSTNVTMVRVDELGNKKPLAG